MTLRNAILDKPDLFVATMTEKCSRRSGAAWTRDMPAVRACCARPRRDYRFSSIVLGIVRSVPFRMRMTPARASRDDPDGTGVGAAFRRPNKGAL